MVRHYDKKELRGFIRISVGKPEHTDALMKAFKKDDGSLGEINITWRDASVTPTRVQLRKSQFCSVRLKKDDIYTSLSRECYGYDREL
ncbi:hypothetical protein GOP47_0013298 [Adiantum capillus-veneris]|uniref:Uncharacterized protein n=1 Tax=Adiantum capillus-veneris TaxID=13818 RepID=A0A9D4ZEE7_ADICA|nr:hypothetical protein GOP47_0013298 [Adiantum capillus-veneris]